MNSKKDALRILGVIEKLEVGPVRLERNRLTAPYTVTQKGSEESTELMYRFEEDVFQPGEQASLNLASMLAVQVALNYGLFCEEMVFRGAFDRHDQRFLEDMAKNTAREIFVKKFLEPNPFLRGAAGSLPPGRREHYLQARLAFVDDHRALGAMGNKEENKSAAWDVDRLKYAVLSSGGKESLLSFGLLTEMGHEIHPVFINESGRHWFTSLNAYRHFSAHVPRTSRVWTNSDRLFNWMLRRLPFVREDFSTLRSDAYPIRLWTVAVFLFGALPILKKRGIGRLLIGDEFDTSQRLSSHGIPHYNGLYDQSRYFDNALTRYFHRKGWGVSQFSVLRTHSELLIEKILVERYPELQTLQTSCHAAHKDGERVRPCGKCEKCRRVVGMLKALGADPARCGYTTEQIDHCLRNLPEKGVHQERGDAEHLAFLLSQQGLIDKPAFGAYRARQKPEVMKLRFDPERSPMQAIPAELREALYRISLDHAAGAVKRNGRIWLDFDPLHDQALYSPYPFEPPHGNSPFSGTDPENQEKLGRVYVLGELSWPEAKRRFGEVDVALLPVGAIEQHGPHLPLDTDAFDADYLAQQVAQACKDPKPLVLPLISYGVSYHHEDFSGTLSLSPDTLSQVVYEIGMNAARHGIRKLVIINGHGGNIPALHFAAQKINRDAHIFTCVETGETSDPDIAALSDTPNDVHAGEIETSMSLAVRPGLVKMEEGQKFIPKFSSSYLDFTSRRGIDWYARTAHISPQGVLGDPTKATREKGEQFWGLTIKNLVDFIENIKPLSLEEVIRSV